MEMRSESRDIEYRFNASGGATSPLSPLDDDSEEEENPQALEDYEDSDESGFETASGSSHDFDDEDSNDESGDLFVDSSRVHPQKMAVDLPSDVRREPSDGRGIR